MSREINKVTRKGGKERNEMKGEMASLKPKRNEKGRERK